MGRLFNETRPSIEARRLLVFMHVPKTGGTTLDRLVFRRLVPAERVFPVNWRDVEGSWDEFLTELDEDPSRHAYASGHISYRELRRLDRPHMAFGFVREPVARTVSQYRYHVSEEFEDHVTFRRNYPTFGDFLHEGRALYENLQTRFLAGDAACSADEALRIVEESYDFLGVQDLFEISAFHLLECAGVHGMIPEGRLRVSRPTEGFESAPTEEELQVVRERTETDRVLYEFARERLLDRYVTAKAQRDLISAINRFRADRFAAAAELRAAGHTAERLSEDGLAIHDDSGPERSRIGTIYAPFRKTYAWNGDFLGSGHAAYANALVRGAWPDDGPWLDIAIDGFLRPIDALKLYELAYFAEGPILELGTYRGLATSVICRAVADAAHDGPIHSIDLCEADLRIARDNLGEVLARDALNVECIDARAALDRHAGNGERLALCYVDHAHGYEDVATVCEALPDAIGPGGFVMFADYNCIWNLRLARDKHAVHQAVDASLDPERFAFYGVFGSSAVFRRRAG